MFNGITRGLELIAGFLKLFVKAVESHDGEAIADGVSLARVWIGETINEAGAVRVSGWGLVFGGSDPWRTSRMMYREFALKWNGKL